MRNGPPGVRDAEQLNRARAEGDVAAVDLPSASPPRRPTLRRAFDDLRRRAFGYDVFVSHAWQDGHDLARRLCDALARRGLNCFLDDREMSDGDRLSTRIEAALRRSAVLVVLLTPCAYGREWVETEARSFAAARPRRAIIPVRLGQQPPPGARPHLLDLSTAVLGQWLPAAGQVGDEAIDGLAGRVADARGRLTTRRQAICMLGGVAASAVAGAGWLTYGRHAARKQAAIDGWLARGRDADGQHRRLAAEVAYARAAALGSAEAVQRYRDAAAARRLLPCGHFSAAADHSLLLATGHASRPVAATVGVDGALRVHDGGGPPHVVEPRCGNSPTVSFDAGRLLFHGDNRLVGYDLTTRRAWSRDVPDLARAALFGDTVVGLNMHDGGDTMTVLTRAYDPTGRTVERRLRAEGRILTSRLTDDGDVAVLARAEPPGGSAYLSLQRFDRAADWARHDLYAFLLPRDQAGLVYGGDVGCAAGGVSAYLAYGVTSGAAVEPLHARRKMIRPGRFPRVVDDASDVWRKMIPLTAGSHWGATLARNGSLEALPVPDAVLLDQPRQVLGTGIADAREWATTPAQVSLVAAEGDAPSVVVYELCPGVPRAVCRLDYPPASGDISRPRIVVSRDGTVVAIVLDGRAYFWTASAPPTAGPVPDPTALEAEAGVRWDAGGRLETTAFSAPPIP